MNTNTNNISSNTTTHLTECISQQHNQMNTKLYSRNIPSQPLQPYINVRPAMTKYSHFPIVTPRKAPIIPLDKYPVFNTNQIFNPGNTEAPWSGFASNVNTESELRNQIYALQKCSQATYVPESNSSLYIEPKQSATMPEQQQQYKSLFQSERFAKFNPNPDPKKIGVNIFMNSTRNQLKDMTKQTC